MKREFRIGRHWIVRDDAGMKDEHKEVLDLLIKANGEMLHQRDIAKQLMVGYHERHEADLPISEPSTLRKVRQIINDLRLQWGIPVLSFGSAKGGYWIPQIEEDVIKAYDRLQNVWAAEANSFMRTRRFFQKTFKGIIDNGNGGQDEFVL